MKPGIKTTEFWLVVTANVLTQVGALDVPDRYRWIVATATIVGYALSRGLAKQKAPNTARAGSLLDQVAQTLRQLQGRGGEAKAPDWLPEQPTRPASTPPAQGVGS